MRLRDKLKHSRLSIGATPVEAVEGADGPVHTPRRGHDASGGLGPGAQGIGPAGDVRFVPEAPEPLDGHGVEREVGADDGALGAPRGRFGLGDGRPKDTRSAGWLTRGRAAEGAFDTGAMHGDDRISQLRALIGDVVSRDRRRLESGRAGAHSEVGRAGAFASEPQPLTFGEQHETAAGRLHVVERWLEPDHCHGHAPVRAALTVDAQVLARLALDPALAEVDLSRMLIFDTETTGLAGGAGTVPFLIGLAYFEDGVLKVEQLFLPNFGGEVPMLHRLAERIANASCLVSYNGKSFDWPLLRARFVLNRVACPEPPVHLDLLHCARRVLRSRMESVRLTAVERELLGFHREDDVDGSLIPALYLNYLRGADPDTMRGVLVHNDHDVVALAAILGRLCEHFDQLVASDDPREHLAYARVALRAADLDRADDFAEAAASCGGEASLRLEARSLQAAVARKRGDASSAAAAWLQALEEAPCEQTAAEVHFALAKLYEHQLKDMLRAHSHARWTLPVEGPQAHGRRLGRLRRRLERDQA